MPTLEPAVGGAHPVPIPFHRFFWDCDPTQLDTARHTDQILARLLDLGDLAAARWALRTYGPERLREFVRAKGERLLSRKTLSLWRCLLDGGR